MVELQQHRRMVRWPAGGLGINSAKPKLGQIEPPDKDINHANRIILANPIFQAPQQSASSDPSANRAGIIPQESHQPARFYTARVNRDRGGPRRSSSRDRIGTES